MYHVWVAGKEEWVTNGIYYSLPIETLKFTCFSIKSTQSRHSSKFSGPSQFLEKLIRSVKRKNYGFPCTIGPASRTDTHHLPHPAGLSSLAGRLPGGV